jgi:hypothetical protein
MFFVKQKKHKFKNKMFAIIPDKDNDASFQIHGLSLLVLEEDKFEVSGIRLLPNGNENFICHIDNFEKLLHEGMIEEIVDEENGKIPKYIITIFKKQYKKNLQDAKKEV